jgi:hypothetical protein
MLGTSCDFQLNYATETGAGADNNSFFDCVELDDYACWIVADSDSETGCEIARSIVQSILNSFSDKPTILQREMKQYLTAAREMAVKLSGKAAVRIGLAIVATDYAKMLCITTGNERIYYLRQVLRRRADDADADDGFELGVTVNDEQERLGRSAQNEIFRLFIARTISLGNGDAILLASSGFWKNVAFAEISKTLRVSDESFQFLVNLKQLQLKKRQADLLSYTIGAIYINRVKGLAGNIKTVGVVLLAGVLLLTGLIVFKPSDNQKAPPVAPGTQVTQTTQQTRPQNYAGYEQNGDYLVKDEEYALALDEYIKASACEDLKTVEARQTVQSKIEITQMILDGDQMAATGNFAGALAKYQAAKKATNAVVTYNQAGLEKKTATIQVKLTVNELIAKGDRAASQQNYKEALSQYSSAKTLAKNVLYDISKYGLDAKIIQLKRSLTEEGMLAEGSNPEDSNSAEEQQAEKPSSETAQKERGGTSRNSLIVFRYNTKVGPPPGFFDGNKEALMAAYCKITDKALVLDTTANPSASPCYRLSFPSGRPTGFTFTVVTRVKVGSQYGLDFDFRGAGFRERVCLLADGIRLECAGRQSAPLRAIEWHTYCMNFEVTPGVSLLVRVYVDGEVEPAIWGVSTVTDNDNCFRFGDLSGYNGYLGTLEWLAWSFDDAYTPEQISLPRGFGWK